MPDLCDPIGWRTVGNGMKDPNEPQGWWRYKSVLLGRGPFGDGYGWWDRRIRGPIFNWRYPEPTWPDDSADSTGHDDGLNPPIHHSGESADVQ